MDLAPARAERSAPRTIDQEVFENESPIAAMERPAAFTADQLLVCGYRSASTRTTLYCAPQVGHSNALGPAEDKRRL
jgi:hypothetical protein